MNEVADKTRRRWFTFNLRTLFVLTTVSCLSVAVGISLHSEYKRRQLERQEFRRNMGAAAGGLKPPWSPRSQKAAP
jgi:hypothetical protein